MLVKKSRSSTEKLTGLSKNPWRLGESPSEVCGQESTEKIFRSGGNKGDFWLSRKALSDDEEEVVEEEEEEEERVPAVPFGPALGVASSVGVR